MKLLKIKTLTGYEDPDNVILHACFAVLVEFVEHGFDNVMWKNTTSIGTDGSVLHVGKEILNLYDWWLHGREKFRKQVPKKPQPWPKFRLSGHDPDPPKTREWLDVMYRWPKDRRERQNAKRRYYTYLDRVNRHDQACDEKDYEALVRLMRIRRYLWY